MVIPSSTAEDDLGWWVLLDIETSTMHRISIEMGCIESGYLLEMRSVDCEKWHRSENKQYIDDAINRNIDVMHHMMASNRISIKPYISINIVVDRIRSKNKNRSNWKSTPLETGQKQNERRKRWFIWILNRRYVNSTDGWKRYTYSGYPLICGLS